MLVNPNMVVLVVLVADLTHLYPALILPQGTSSYAPLHVLAVPTLQYKSSGSVDRGPPTSTSALVHFEFWPDLNSLTDASMMSLLPAVQPPVLKTER